MAIRRLRFALAFVCVAAMEHHGDVIADESGAVFLRATYERAWLIETGWSITVWHSGRVEEQLVKNRCGRKGCGEDRVKTKRRATLTRQQLEALRSAVEDGAFFDLQPNYRSGAEDYVAARLFVSVGDREHEVRVEDPWWNGGRADPAFAKAWNLVVKSVRPSAKNELGWEIR